MGEQVAAGIKKRKPLKRVFYKNGDVYKRQEAHRLVILHALEEVIPPDAAADTTERKDQITRLLLLQV